MKYDPNDAVKELLPRAHYDAECVKAEDKFSRAGAAMLVVTSKIFGPAPEEYITDYMVEGMQRSIAKLKGLCVAVGLDFASGNLDPAALVGKGYRVKVYIQEDKSGEYGPKNAIGGYMAHGTEVGDGDKSEPVKDDEIPF